MAPAARHATKLFCLLAAILSTVASSTTVFPASDIVTIPSTFALETSALDISTDVATKMSTPDLPTVGITAGLESSVVVSDWLFQSLLTTVSGLESSVVVTDWMFHSSLTTLSASHVFDIQNSTIDFSPSATATVSVSPSELPTNTPTTSPPPTTITTTTTTTTTPAGPTTPNPVNVFRCGNVWVQFGVDSEFEMPTPGVVSYRCRDGFEDDGTGVATITCVNRRWDAANPLNCVAVEPPPPQTSVPLWLVAVLVVLTVLVAVVFLCLAYITSQVIRAGRGFSGRVIRVLPRQETTKPPTSVKGGNSRRWPWKRPPRPRCPPGHLGPDGVAWIVNRDNMAFPLQQ